MPLYQYPEVRVPSSQHLPLSQPSVPTHDGRYSFAPGLAAEQKYFSALPPPQHEIPPVPQVPQYESAGYNSDSSQVGGQDHQGSDYKDQILPKIETTDIKDTLVASKKSRKAPPPAISTFPTVRSSIIKPPIPLEPDQNPLTQNPTDNLQWQDPQPITAGSIPSHPSIYPQHNPYTPVPTSIEGGTWQHSLCSCAEPSICIPSIFCPCITYGRTQYRLGLRSEKKDPANMLGYSVINGSCIAFGLLCGVNSLLAAIQHTRIRKAYGMSKDSGNMAADCAKALCCCCCLVAQDEKEVRYREEEARRGPSGRKEGYLSPGAMVFTR